MDKGAKSEDKCRVCGVYKEKKHLPYKLDEKVTANHSYREYFEKFTGFKYMKNEQLPERICATCAAEIKLFIFKTEDWNKHERRLQKRKVDVPTMNDAVISKKPKTEQTSFQEIRELFKIDRNASWMKYENFHRIEVERSSLDANGAISQKWLRENIGNVIVWSGLKFQCSCDKEVTSLIEYLNHANTHGPMKIKCPETDCRTVLNSLPTYMNHAATHHVHLSYCCIECSTIFFNIPALMTHYESLHGNIQKLFVCPECAHYFQNMQYLKSHKQSHHTPIAVKNELTVQTTEMRLVKSEYAFQDGEEPRKKIGRPRNNSTRSSLVATKSSENLVKPERVYHPKTRFFEENSDRPTFPCNYPGCNKILMTRNGAEYHRMVHAGERPFPCDYCEKRFRSKQVKDSHERVCVNN